MNILGIDLAGSEKRPTGIAYLDNQNKIKKMIIRKNGIDHL